MWLQMGKDVGCKVADRGASLHQHSPPLHPCHASWSDSACVTKTYTYICIYIHPTPRIGSFVWRFWSTTQCTWQCHTDVPRVHICTPCLYVMHLCLSDIRIYTCIHTFLSYSFYICSHQLWILMMHQQFCLCPAVTPPSFIGSLTSHHPSLAM